MNKNWNELTKEEKKFKLGAAVSVLFLISLMLPGFSLSGVKGGRISGVSGLKLEFRFGLFLSILSAVLMFLASKIKPE